MLPDSQSSENGKVKSARAFGEKQLRSDEFTRIYHASIRVLRFNFGVGTEVNAAKVLGTHGSRHR